MFFQANTALVVLIVAALIVVAGHLGFYVGRNPGVRAVDSDSLGIIQAASFTLLGLLLGFSFSLALSRYDARRTVTVKEANAIGTLLLRAQLLPTNQRQVMHQYLKRYATARLGFAEAGANEDRQARESTISSQMQERMWNIARSESARDPRSTITPLFVQSLNDTIDVSGEQAAALNAHIPDAVLYVLICVMLLAASLLGFSIGKSSGRVYVPVSILAVILALVIGTTLDLDRPQRGFIRVDLTPLQQVQAAAAANWN